MNDDVDGQCVEKNATTTTTSNTNQKKKRKIRRNIYVFSYRKYETFIFNSYINSKSQAVAEIQEQQITKPKTNNMKKHIV